MRARALFERRVCEARVEHKPNYSNVVVCSSTSSGVKIDAKGWGEKVLYVFHKAHYENIMYTCGGEGIIANYEHATLPPVPLQKSGTKKPPPCPCQAQKTTPAPTKIQEKETKN